MGVTNTPNIALFKPDDTELAKNWAINTFVQEHNNNNLMAQVAEPTVTSYSPLIVAQSVNPATGNGSRRGEYQLIQGFVTGSFSIEFIDPGVASGTGEYGVSLPFVVDPVFHSVGGALNSAPGGFSVIGEAFIMDNSAVATSGFAALDVVTISGVSYVRFLTELFTAPAKTSRFLTDTQPYTTATSDSISGSFFYKKQ